MSEAPEVADLSDRELWQRAAGGDTGAFEAIYLRHVDAIHAYCTRRIGSDTAYQDADDVVAAVFSESWRRRSEVTMVHDSALPWLYGVARFALSTKARSSNRQVAAAGRMAPPDTVDDHAEAVVSRIDDARRLDAVRWAMAQLTADDQDILHLCVWQQLDYKQAAVALGIPAGTVKSRLSRARARLIKLVDSPHCASQSKEVAR